MKTKVLLIALLLSSTGVMAQDFKEIFEKIKSQPEITAQTLATQYLQDRDYGALDPYRTLLSEQQKLSDKWADKKMNEIKKNNKQNPATIEKDAKSIARIRTLAKQITSKVIPAAELKNEELARKVAVAMYAANRAADVQMREVNEKFEQTRMEINTASPIPTPAYAKAYFDKMNSYIDEYNDMASKEMYEDMHPKIVNAEQIMLEQINRWDEMFKLYESLSADSKAKVSAPMLNSTRHIKKWMTHYINLNSKLAGTLIMNRYVMPKTI